MKLKKNLIVFTVAAGLVAASYAVVVADDFTIDGLGSRWTVCSFPGATNAVVGVSGGVLNVQGTGTVDPAYVALELENYRIVPESWKSGILVRQFVEPSSIASGESVTASIGLQWGVFDQTVALPSNINGYYAAATFTNSGTVANLVSWIGGASHVDNVGSDSKVRKFVGKITATYTAKKDRLVVQVGRFKATIPSFESSSSFTGNPEVLLSGHTPESVSGLAYTFDSFTASGNGVMPW